MSREQMRGRSLLEDLPVQYHDNLARTLAGESIRVEGRIPPELCADESWTRVATLPIRDESGSVCGGMVIVVDISQQKRADELVESSPSSTRSPSCPTAPCSR